MPQTKVIEKARTVGIVGGRDNMKVVIFILIGFILSMIISIIIRLFFEKISQVKELSDLTRIPVLGGLPLLKDFDKILNIKIRSKDTFVESLRAIRTSMNFLMNNDSSSESAFKSFLITSIHPGEGKNIYYIKSSQNIC